MAHVRQQIRTRLSGTTLTGLTTTGTNVHASRPTVGRPLETLPALCIYTDTDEVLQELETFEGSVRKEAHLLSILVEGYAEATSNLDNTLDTISTEVEVAMAGDETINSLVESSNLVSTEFEFDADGEKPRGIIRLTYEALYRINPADPETALT